MSFSRGARRLSAAALVAALGTTAACLDLRPPSACTISVAPATLTLPVNGSATIVGTAFNCDGNTIADKRINYSSSNTAVATVTAEGNVIAVSVGTATVSAVADGKSAAVAVTVTPEAAANVTINPAAITLRRTNTRQLAATARNAANLIIQGRTFRWTSSNTAIASVDQAGLVTAVGTGTAVITAETDQTVGQAQVIVTEIPIGSCALSPTSFRVTTGQGVQPTLTLRDTANNIMPTLGRAVAWSSSNENVAAVSATGFATTRRAGTATITASSVEFPAVTCSATVEAVDPRIAQVVIAPRIGSLRLGVPRAFQATLFDSANTAITGRAPVWSTNTPTVIQVTQAGIVTGLSLGTARIIARADDVADTVTLQVTRIPVATVQVTPLQASVIEGQTVQFRATVTDSAGTEVTDRPVEWLSSDPTRASVNQSGFVTTVSAGVVNIFATSENRSAQASLLIQQIAVDTIVAPLSFSLPRGATLPFAIEVRDAQGNVLRNRTVEIRSDNPAVANAQSVTTTAQVSVAGLQVGTATLTLQALNANGQAQGKATRVNVTVTLPVAAPVRRE
ncbi:MAG: Ig-like domain-containing protein [Gemmatimonas sp.]|uniref:Ig-like domain-containing protein n=1 Tax=Gemmatimonas sp. TaxID=1962908 RepID=UPI0025B99265|nr:Ig-like domain-containing protein [Gemmatimonas sp.]MCE2954185.1 Ig-like domain-containing protein [Gemmatimonas sp.]